MGARLLMWCVRLAHGEFHYATNRDGLMVVSLAAWKVIDRDAFMEFCVPGALERERLQKQFMKASGLDVRDRVIKQAREH